MKKTILILAVALAGYGCASTPADPAADPSAAAAPAAATPPPAAVTQEVNTDTSESKLVCTSVANTGTRLATRQCKTPAQIEADRQNAKETTNTYQRDGAWQKKSGGG